MIVVLVPGVLRGEVDGASRLTLDVSADATVGSVLDEIGARWPRFERRIRDERGDLRRFVNIYVDGEDCRRSTGLTTPVHDGAEIQLLPSVAGG